MSLSESNGICLSIKPSELAEIFSIKDKKTVNADFSKLTLMCTLTGLCTEPSFELLHNTSFMDRIGTITAI